VKQIGEQKLRKKINIISKYLQKLLKILRIIGEKSITHYRKTDNKIEKNWQKIVVKSATILQNLRTKIAKFANKNY
jgi:hypothetical protein